MQRPVRTPVGIWLESRIVRRPPSPRYATVQRGSIGLGATRWFSMSIETTCAAARKPSSVFAALPCFMKAVTLSGAPGQSAGAPGRIAASGSVTAGSTS